MVRHDPVGVKWKKPFLAVINIDAFFRIVTHLLLASTDAAYLHRVCMLPVWYFWSMLYHIWND